MIHQIYLTLIVMSLTAYGIDDIFYDGKMKAHHGKTQFTLVLLGILPVFATPFYLVYIIWRYM